MTAIQNQLVPLDVLTFDNVGEVRVTTRIRVTKHPVEFGVEVSDHAQREPVGVQLIEARITETPFPLPAPGAVELALSFFERNEGQLVTITTSRGVFADMVIEQFDWAIAGRKEIVFNVTASNVKIAKAVSVPIPPRTPAPALQAGAASAADAGVQPQAEVPPPPDVSLLQTFTSFLGV